MQAAAYGPERARVGLLNRLTPFWHLRAMLLCDMARQEIWYGDPDSPRPHPWRFQLSCSASPMMMPSGPRRKQSR